MATDSVPASRLFTTAQAAAYCALKTPGAVRKLVHDGRLSPAARRGGRGTLMFAVETLDAFLGGREPVHSEADRQVAPQLSEATMTSYARLNKTKFIYVFATPTAGHYVRARVTDPTTDKLVAIKKTLQTKDPLEAFQWLEGEIDEFEAARSYPRERSRASPNSQRC